MLIAWTMRALFESGSASSPWMSQNVTADEASGYFFDELIGMETLTPENGLRPNRVIGTNIGYAFLVQFIIFISVAFGKDTNFGLFVIITYSTSC